MRGLLLTNDGGQPHIKLANPGHLDQPVEARRAQRLPVLDVNALAAPNIATARRDSSHTTRPIAITDSGCPDDALYSLTRL